MKNTLIHEQHTACVDEEEVDGSVQRQHNGAGHNLRPDNLLSLKVVCGSDVGCKSPHSWQGPPVQFHTH